MNLDEARAEIRTVDEEMRGLFLRRMEAVREVAAYKAERGLPVEDLTQESRVIADLAPAVENTQLRSYYVNFLHDVMDNSKRWQHHLIEGTRVAYSGVEGAFAHIAVTQIFPDAAPVSYPSFEDAYRAVEDGECDICVLPFENSYAGEVGQVLDLMFSGSLHVNGVYNLSVTQCLLGVPGATIEDVRAVVSHPQALTQCESYIRRRGFASHAAENTALAAQRVAATGDKSLAAIASTMTASLYGLQVLDHDINESRANTTRFAVFSRVESGAIDKGEKAAFLLLFTVKDEAGGLAKAVNVISSYGFNMRVLRSRPMKDLAWHYYFYVEAEGDDTAGDGKRMLAALRAACPIVKVVGRYVADRTLREEPVEGVAPAAAGETAGEGASANAGEEAGAGVGEAADAGAAEEAGAAAGSRANGAVTAEQEALK